MSDALYVGLWLLGGLTLWFVLACVLGVVMGRCLRHAEPDPWPSDDFFQLHFAGVDMTADDSSLYGQMAEMWAPEVVGGFEALLRGTA